MIAGVMEFRLSRRIGEELKRRQMWKLVWADSRLRCRLNQTPCQRCSGKRFKSK